MRKRLFSGTIALAALMLLLAACQPAAPEPTEVPPTEVPTEVMEEEPTEEEMMVTPSVSVEDQTIEGGQVTVPSATSDGPGWVVIHADDNGAPGAVIGYAAVSDGENSDVVVGIDTEMATPTLYAMLHTDSGEEGTYEFPDGDPPVKVEDSVVVKPFQAESGEMSMGAEVALAENDEFGPFLVDSEGMALYLFTQDTENTSNCYGDCADAWPPLLTEGDPAAGEGVDGSLLGTIERDDGSMQVTYNGWPLYYFVQDGAAGDTKGQGVNDVWFLLSPDGEGIGMGSMGEESMGTEVVLAESEEYGQFLADNGGMALYLFTNDTENTSNCYDQCAENWPPLLTEGEPAAGEGVDESLLGTTERDDGSMQVTYNGWPLYYFASDEAAGDTKGQGIGDVWYLLSPEGKGIGRKGEEDMDDNGGYDY